MALAAERKLPEMKRFLAALAADMGEQCIYLEASGLEASGEASFVYAAKRPGGRR